MNKGNLWIFNHYAIPPDRPGGTRHYELGRELRQRGYGVTIFASSFSHKGRIETKRFPHGCFVTEEVGGIRFVWVKTTPYVHHDGRRVVNMLSYAVNAHRAAVSADLEKPDIIVGSSVHLFAVLTAQRLARRWRVPFLMEVRDLWPQTLIDLGVSRRHPFVLVLGGLERYLYKRADRIITLLPRAHEYLEAQGVAREKIVCIPNGVNLENFPRPAADGGNGGGSGTFTVGYFGAMGTANDLGVAVAAAKYLQDDCPEIKLVLTGEGPERPRLAEQVRRAGIRNVEFRPPVAKAEIPAAMGRADVLYAGLKDLGLYRYGISLNKLFDYLAAAKPIVFASKAANNPVQEAGAGLTVAPGDPAALAGAIRELYQMPAAARRELGRRGREYVERHHSMAVLGEKLERVMEEVRERGN